MLNDIREKMDKTIETLDKNYKSIRAGRANPAVLDKVLVDYYGTPTPINQMAAVSVAEARVLTIQPWDASTVKEIEKAIQASDIGINPQSDGKIIRMTFPALTEEHRKDIVKSLGKQCEEAKVSIRNIRREANDKFKAMKKSSEITEDDLADKEEQVQKLTDEFCKEVDKLTSEKEKEILSI